MSLAQKIVDEPDKKIEAVHAALVAINPSATPFRLDALEGLRSIRDAHGRFGIAGAKLAFEVERARESLRVLDPTDKFTVMGKLGLAVTPFSAISGAVKSVQQYGLAKEAAVEYLETRTDEARAKVIGTTAKLSATVVGTGLSSAESYVTGRKLLVTYLAAKKAFEAAAPLADRRIARTAGWAAAKHLLENGGRPTAEVLRALRVKAFDLGLSSKAIGDTLRGASVSSVERAVHASVAAKSSKLGINLAQGLGQATRPAARATLDAAAEAAGRATVKAGIKNAAGLAAKGLARFAPGLNIALAGLDSAMMYSTLKDPKASNTRKVASVVTMLGAWVSATNVPLVSQAGALVSMVSAFVGAFF